LRKTKAPTHRHVVEVDHGGLVLVVDSAAPNLLHGGQHQHVSHDCKGMTFEMIPGFFILEIPPPSGKNLKKLERKKTV
jgi:hypothetical protein